MTIVIKKQYSESDIKLALEKFSKKSKSKGLKKHFGLLKTDIDAVKYQKELRNEWN